MFLFLVRRIFLNVVGSFLQVEEEEEESRSRKLVNVVKVKMSGVESSNSWSKRGNFADFYLNELHSLMSWSRPQAALSSLHSV